MPKKAGGAADNLYDVPKMSYLRYNRIIIVHPFPQPYRLSSPAQRNMPPIHQALDRGGTLEG